MNNPMPFAVPDITVRKNAGLVHAADFTLPQPRERYTAEDHASWAHLFARQRDVLAGRACDAFHEGLARLALPEDRIPDFDTVNARLAALTGWRIVAVPGLIPDAEFFAHLAARRFPVTWWIREPDSLDYLEEPDVFHDLFGHVPLLSDPVFADFLQAYGARAMAAPDAASLTRLARLYWYTVEFGLIATPGGLRIYGAGIVSSSGESRHALESPVPLRLAFDADRVMRTLYKIDSFQAVYFVIAGFDALFDAALSAGQGVTVDGATIAPGVRLAGEARW